LQEIRSAVADHIEESIAVKQALLGMTAPIEGAADLLVERLKAGHRVVIFGNGGSAADAQHFAAEMVGRLEVDHGCLPVVALTTDTSILTAVANDFGYDHIFARQVHALVRQGDVAIGISTSGNSANVVEGLRAARARGGATIGMVGESGGRMAELCDHLIRVPSKRTMRIQECHLTVVHILCFAVERAFVDG
jgi:D-sedoheptulose 7-phosphate isomerase